MTPLPPGAPRARVYAGQDPVTKTPSSLTESVPAGPRRAHEAKKIKTLFLNQIDQKRNPKTRATVDQLMVKYFDVVDVDVL
jgi:integrase